MAAVPVLSSIRIQQTARDLGVVIDSRLSLSDNVAAVCRSGYYQLRQLRPIVRCSSEDAAKTTVQAFVISRLDYCNALCYGITDELTRCLQSVQNAAARLVTGTRRCDHISPVLRQLHWLPVQQFWRQDLCRRRTTSLEQSAAQFQTMWAVIQPV